MNKIIEFIIKYPMLSIAWILLLFLVIISIIKNIFSKVKKITNYEAMYQIKKQKAIMIDIRSQKDYDNGHILGSINIPIYKIQKFDFYKLQKYKNKKIILIYHNENDLLYSAKKLISSGFRVFILALGLQGWIHDNLPLVSK